MAQLRQDAGRLPRRAQVQGDHPARPHIAGQQHRRTVRAQLDPAQPCDRGRNADRFLVLQVLCPEGNAELGAGLRRFRIGDLGRGQRAKIRHRLSHGGRIEIRPTRPRVVLVALFDFIVPQIARKTLGPRHGVALAAEAPDARFRRGVDHSRRSRRQERRVPLVHLPRTAHQHGKGRQTAKEQPGGSEDHQARVLSGRVHELAAPTVLHGRSTRAG